MEDDEKQAKWLETWMRSASAKGSMSQRSASSVARFGGGLDRAALAARAASVHLLLLTDDKGGLVVAASRHPFRVLA